MWSKTQIEPVPAHRRRAAACFLAAGASDNPVSAARAERLLFLADQEDQQVFWWARRGRRASAAAMVLRRPGHTGLLLANRTDAPGADAAALSDVVEQAARQAAETWDLSLVQAFADPHEHAEVDMLARAGLQRLAELIYLSRDLADSWPRPDLSNGPCRITPSGPDDQAELARTIELTYEGTLDCPALCGLRPIEDVLASHRTSGAHRPQWWWLARWLGKPAGCVLLGGAAARADRAEVIYLGVCPAYRGRGLGRQLLDWSLHEVSREGVRSVQLAVDAANRYALALYHAAGFAEGRRSVAMALLRRRSADGETSPLVGEM